MVRPGTPGWAEALLAKSDSCSDGLAGSFAIHAGYRMFFCSGFLHLHWLLALTKDAQQCCPMSMAGSRGWAELISGDLSL